MHKDAIPVDLEVVKEIIMDLFKKDKNLIRTSDIIRGYSGGFYSNKKTPASRSFNALFGKLLKRNSIFLGIREVNSGVSVQDDLPSPYTRQTTTSEWKRAV